MTDPEAQSMFVDPELDGTNAAIARDMREAAKASQDAPDDSDPSTDSDPSPTADR